jgi:guanylate kinase
MSKAVSVEISSNSPVKGTTRPAPGSVPRLELRSEFEKALHNFHLSADALATLKATPFVIMLAPTSTGRNTIIDELIKTGHYHFIVSDTTRPQRSNDGVMERDGVEYFFRTEQDMLADINAGRFIEAEIIHEQQVSGTSIRELEKAHKQGKIAITDVDIIGAQRIAELKPDAVPVLLLPPSFDEWLRRINKRGAPAPEDFYRRLGTAIKIITMGLASKKFVFVVNDNFAEAVKAVDDMARLGEAHRTHEAHARDVARSIVEQTKAYLKEHAPQALPN